MSGFDGVDEGLASPVRHDKLRDARGSSARMVLLRMGVVDPGLSHEISREYVGRGRPFVYSPSDHLRRRVGVRHAGGAPDLFAARALLDHLLPYP